MQPSDGGAADDQTALIREALRERARTAVARGWSRIERHLAAPLSAEPGPRGCEDEDAEFWLRFRGQLDEAKQNLPRGADSSAVFAPNDAMPEAQFMHAARMPTAMRALRARDGEAADVPAARPGGYCAAVIVSPTNVVEAWPCAWLGSDEHSVTPQQGNAAESRMRAAAGSKRRGKSSDPNSIKHTTPATVAGGGKRRRARASVPADDIAHGAYYSTPSKQTQFSSSTLFSPGQEAAKSLLALRHAVC
jgi:hypothetical protein